MAQGNLQVVFKSRPQAAPQPENFELREVPLPTPAGRDVLVRSLFLSVDPYMRGRMRERRSYAANFEPGQPMRGGVVGQVSASGHPDFPEGSFVLGDLPWQHYALAPEGRGLASVDPALAPLSYYLGVLGMPGMTAWYGLLEIGQPKAGETVVVSAASGAVGQVVGQIARLKDCRVVGTVGSEEKAAYVRDELGFDAVVNYRAAQALGKAIGEACPDGIDVHFENVGGPMLDAVLARINPFARIVACGMISQYNLERPEGIHNLINIVGNRAKIQGFIVSDHNDRRPEFLKQMSGWLKEGRIHYRESVVQGLENAPRALMGLFEGENFGKQVVQIAEPA